MAFKFNPFSGFLDLVNDAELPDLGSKFKYHMNALAAYDRISNVQWADFGTRNQRIDSITYSSAAYPESDVTVSAFYLDLGKMTQRIDKIEISGSVFLPDSLRKRWHYVIEGSKFKLTGFTYEVFY